VISYDAKKKRHKVLYDDGEQEILDLGVERWQLTTKKQRFVKNPQDTSSKPAWAPVPLRELNKAKALAQQEDVPRPSNQLYVLLPPCTIYPSFWLSAIDSNKSCILYWHLFFFTKT
jgi:hypothetical protein